MQYRAMTANDAEFLTRIFSIPEYELYFSENETTAAEWKERIPYYQDARSVIISDGAKDVGWLMYRIEGSVCFIDILVLLPDERYKGYGRSVMRDLLDRSPQIRTVKLDVQKRNRSAISFYENIGFLAISEEYQPVADGRELYCNMRLER